MVAKGIYINLATNNIIKTKEFFVGIGFEFVEDFSDENGICIKAADNIFMMFMNGDKFNGFTKLELTDSKKEKEVILGFELDSIKAVDEAAKKVVQFGGTVHDPVELDFMYYIVFKDLDGHHFELFTFK